MQYISRQTQELAATLRQRHPELTQRQALRRALYTLEQVRWTEEQLAELHQERRNDSK